MRKPRAGRELCDIIKTEKFDKEVRMMAGKQGKGRSAQAKKADPAEAEDTMEAEDITAVLIRTMNRKKRRPEPAILQTHSCG